MGEPLAGVKEQITKLKLAAEKPINHSLLLVLSVRLIIGATEELAWQ